MTSSSKISDPYGVKLPVGRFRQFLALSGIATPHCLFQLSLDTTTGKLEVAEMAHRCLFGDVYYVHVSTRAL